MLTRHHTLTLVLAALIAGWTLDGAVVHTQPAAAPDPSAALKRLKWRSIGPANTGGRVTAIDGLAGNPTTFYVGAADGGVFKTTNGGITFTPVFDGQAVQSIGAIAIAPSDPNVVWVGTGEGNPRNSVSFGDGVYRSTDAGATWTHVGLTDSERIARIRVDPRDPQTAYVAALGHEWGANEERGLFKTIDGGKTWSKVLYIDKDTGCSDVELDPANPRIVYAGMYTYRRRPWRFDSGAGSTGLYKSADGGATWKKLTNGLPKGPLDRIGIAVSRSQPSTVYIVTEAKDEGVLFRSDDGGESWQMMNKDPQLVLRPFYFGVVRVDPRDAQRVYVLGGSLSLSRDGGRTFEEIGRNVHPDHHALWIDPLDPNRLLEGNDGGLYESWDGGKTFGYLNNLAISQFYHVNVDLRQPYHVCGGLQDNFNWCGPSATSLNEGIRKDEWSTMLFGDGFFAVPDPTSPNLVYNDTQGGVIAVTDTNNGGHRSIQPYPSGTGSTGAAIAANKYRFNWNSPIAFSPHDPKTLYFGGNVLFRSTNGGLTWDVISPDLTTNDKSKQQSSGGQVVTDNTAAEFHCTILTIAESPVRAGVIWVGTDDGNVQVTRDGGKAWTDVVKRIAGLPANSWIPTIDASHADAGTAYVAVDRHQDDDFAPHAYKTTDYGQTWTSIAGNLPATGYVHVVREDPKNRSLLYAGTELGVFASWDAGAHWASIRNNLPAVAVRDLQIHPRDNDLIAGTHGRGAWILDDLGPLQHLAEARDSEVFLFDVRPAARYQRQNTNVFPADRHYAGENPPYGAILDYYLRADSKDDVTIVVADANGKPVRRIESKAKEAGVNRVAWDLRYDGPARAASERAADVERAARFGGGPVGPLVVPGDYTVTVKATGREASKSVRVAPDPRINITDADLAAQRDALLRLRDFTSSINAIIDRCADLTKQLESVAEELKRARRAPATSAGGQAGHDGSTSMAQGAGQTSVGQGLSPATETTPALRAVDAALDRIKRLRGGLTRPVPGLTYRYGPGLREEIGSLSGQIGGATAAPTPAQLDRMNELAASVDQVVAEATAIVTRTIPEINTLLAGQPRITVEPLK